MRKIKTLKEIKENFLDKIYYIMRLNLNTGSPIAENNILMVSNQMFKCSCTYEDEGSILNVDSQNGEEDAWLLPYKNGECYGIRIPKELKEKDEGYLFTPSLTGCSIHIIDEGENWLIIHDAKGNSEEAVDTESKRTHNLWFGDKKCVSYEWSSYGYRFVKEGKDLKTIGTNTYFPNDGACMAANVMFYYDSEAGWIILTHNTYGTVSIGGSAKVLESLF